MRGLIHKVGDEYSGSDDDLPWDPIWEFFLGEDTYEDDEHVRFANPWRKQEHSSGDNNGYFSSILSWEHDDDDTKSNPSRWQLRPLSGKIGNEQSSEDSNRRQSLIGWPVAKSRSKDSKEAEDAWAIDFSPFGTGSWLGSKNSIDEPTENVKSIEKKTDKVQSPKKSDKTQSAKRTLSESRDNTADQWSSIKQDKRSLSRRRFLGFGRRRTFDSNDFAPHISKSKISEVPNSSRRSFFFRSLSSPTRVVSSTRKILARPSVRRRSNGSVSQTDISLKDNLSQTMEIASVELSKGLESLSLSGSKILEWDGLDDETPNKKKSSENVVGTTVRPKPKPVSKRDVNSNEDKKLKSSENVVAKAKPVSKRDANGKEKEIQAEGNTMTSSLNALINWMDESDTEKSSTGTSDLEASTLDESNGTHSCDDGVQPSCIDDGKRKERSLQLSSQINRNDSDSQCDSPSMDDDSDSAGEGHSLEESYTDEESGDASDEPQTIDEDSSEERENEKQCEGGNHDFAEEKLTDFDRRLNQRGYSAFSPTTRKSPSVKPEKILQTNMAVQSRQVAPQTPLEARQLEAEFSNPNSIIDDDEEDTTALRNIQSRARESISCMHGTFARIGACLPSRGVTPLQTFISTRKSVPQNELSPRERAELFPKVRSVGDDNSTSSSFFADRIAFDQSKPAHLQASIPRQGPQSLFEYEYETGVHMYAEYCQLGSETNCPMRVCSGRVPLPSCIGSPKGHNKLVVIQVEASTVSQSDCSIRAGDWWGEDRFFLPNTPGVDVVGRIFCLDPETKRKTGFMKGERVMSLVQWGGNSRYIAIDPRKLVKLPEYVDPAMASCLAETFLTAFQVLHIDIPPDLRYEVQSLIGNRTLIIGKAITNLGRAISDLGNIAGGKIYALAKERHFAKVSAIGIRPRDVDSLDWWDELYERIDTIVCIDQDVATIYYKLLKKSGRVVIIRNATSGNIHIGPTKTSIEATRKPGRRKQRPQQQPADATIVYDVFTEWKTNLDLCKEDLSHLVDMLVRKDIQPRVLDRIPLIRVGQAQQMINGRSIKGYIVCEPWLVAKSRAIVL